MFADALRLLGLAFKFMEVRILLVFSIILSVGTFSGLFARLVRVPEVVVFLLAVLVGMKAPGAQIIASVTFIAILVTILIQATTTKWLAKKLDLLAEE